MKIVSIVYYDGLHDYEMRHKICKVDNYFTWQDAYSLIKTGKILANHNEILKNKKEKSEDFYIAKNIIKELNGYPKRIEDFKKHLFQDTAVIFEYKETNDHMIYE